MWWCRPEIPAARRQEAGGLFNCVHNRATHKNQVYLRRKKETKKYEKEKAKQEEKEVQWVCRWKTEGGRGGGKKKQGEKEYFPFYD